MHINNLGGRKISKIIDDTTQFLSLSVVSANHLLLLLHH
jgi:hypothetical protein